MGDVEQDLAGSCVEACIGELGQRLHLLARALVARGEELQSSCTNVRHGSRAVPLRIERVQIADGVAEGERRDHASRQALAERARAAEMEREAQDSGARPERASRPGPAGVERRSCGEDRSGMRAAASCARRS